MVLDSIHPTKPNVVFASVLEPAPGQLPEQNEVELTRANHSLVLDPGVDMVIEDLKYSNWIRTTYSYVVDALSGERCHFMSMSVLRDLAAKQLKVPFVKHAAHRPQARYHAAVCEAAGRRNG